jgi:hypothetical protein
MKFNTKESTRTTNLAGGVAFSISPEIELLHAVLTTFLDDKYYESKEDRIARIKKLISLNKPEFVAKLACVARLEFNLRSVTHLLLGELAKTHKGDSLVKDAIVKCTVRPDDLTELAAYVGTPLPKQLKRGVRNGLLKFNRYQLAKYKGEGNKISLVDLFNLCHPKVKHASEEQKQAWADLIKGDLKSFDTWETEISNSTAEDKSEKWAQLVQTGKMGYMALLRNLNNLIKNNVDEETIGCAIKKLTDPEEVKKSKQMPFRFVTAYDNVKGNRKLTDAISVAMDMAVSNTPKLPGKTLVAVDVSGSMRGDPIRKAAIFGATLTQANPDTDLILYDTRVKEEVVGSRLPVIDLAKKIENDAMGGGTETSLVFKYAIEKKKVYDRIIIISDNESWAEGWGYGTKSIQGWYGQYKKISDPFVYAIDIQGYGTKDIAGGKVFHLCGWSDRLLDYIGKMEEGDALVDYIKNYKI